MRTEGNLLTIRQSIAADGLCVIRIWRDAVDATHDFLDARDREAIEIEVAAFLPQTPLWIAADAQDNPISITLLDGAEMAAVFIDPTHRAWGLDADW